jgi:hypothetical protein
MAEQEKSSDKDKNEKNSESTRRTSEKRDEERAGETTTSQTSTGTMKTSESEPKASQAQKPPSGNLPTSESHPTVGHQTYPGPQPPSTKPGANTATTPQIERPREKLSPKSGDMLVDPRPTEPPIKQGNAEYVFPPAASSSEEVLSLEPNRYEDAVNGPDPQINQTTYVHWTRPDGGDFIAPLSTAEVYERKGYQRGEDEDIPDLVAYNDERAKSDQQRERDKRSQERIEQHDRDRRELLQQQENRRREQTSAR